MQVKQRSTTLKMIDHQTELKLTFMKSHPTYCQFSIENVRETETLSDN